MKYGILKELLKKHEKARYRRKRGSQEQWRCIATNKSFTISAYDDEDCSDEDLNGILKNVGMNRIDLMNLRELKL